MSEKNKWDPSIRVIDQGSGSAVSFIPSYNAGYILIDENGNEHHYTAEQYAAKVHDDQMNAKFDAIIALLTEIRDRLK